MSMYAWFVVTVNVIVELGIKSTVQNLTHEVSPVPPHNKCKSKGATSNACTWCVVKPWVTTCPTTLALYLVLWMEHLILVVPRSGKVFWMILMMKILPKIPTSRYFFLDLLLSITFIFLAVQAVLSWLSWQKKMWDDDKTRFDLPNSEVTIQ